jgi:Zn ribbon nucleic-acid-binding protein
MHFESQGRVVPMLCPGCATLDDIPDWGAKDFHPVIGCHRCGFHFPNLPDKFKKLTLHAIHNHRCEGPEQGDWPALGKAITDGITGKGELPELPPWATSWQ